VKVREDPSQSIVFATRIPTADRGSFANDGLHFFRRAVSILIAIEQNRAGSKREILSAGYKSLQGTGVCSEDGASGGKTMQEIPSSNGHA
jgi:hypothetical protein